MAPYAAVKAHFGLTRKILRLGKFVEHFKAAAVAADAKALDPVLRACAVGRQLGYAAYMLCDNLTVLDAMGVRRSASAKRLLREAYRAWMAGLLCNVVAGAYGLWVLGQRGALVDRGVAEEKVEAKRLER